MVLAHVLPSPLASCIARVLGSSCWGWLSRAARSLGGGGSSAHTAVAMSSRVGQRHVLGGVVEDAPP